MKECKSVRMPMEIGFINDCQNNLNVNKPYRELVECLMYLTQTRADLSFSVNFFSKFQN